MRKLIFILAAGIAFVSRSYAQEAVQLSLKDCMDYALKHNYSVKNAQIDILIQEAQNKQTLSASYPHINGKAEFDDFYIPQKSFIDAHDFNPSVAKGTIEPLSFMVPYGSSAGFTASQLVFDGAVFVAWKARNSVMELARQNAMVSEEMVRYNVFKAYNSLVIAYRQYDIIKSSLIFARSLERDIELTRQSGFAEKIEVERTSVQVNNLASDSIRVSNMLTVAEDVLKFQMGMDMKTRIFLTDTNIEEKRASVAALLTEEQKYERVPEFNVVSTSLKLNEYNLLRYKLAAVPSLNAFWGYGMNYGSDKFSHLFNNLNKWELYSTIGIQLNVPIYNGGLRTWQMKEARLNIEKSRNNIENLKLGLDFQVAQSRTTLKNAILQVQSQRRNMELANDVLDLAQRKYKAGVGSNLEVTQAQTDQLRAETSYFSALLDVINAEADLKKALGLLK